MSNLILATDSYKHSHYLQYPPGTEYLSAYGEARRGAGHDKPVMFFGIQAFIDAYLTYPIHQMDIDEAADLLKLHGLPFNREGWEYILHEHDGYLPLEVTALPEGTVVPRGTPLVQVCNTDPKVPWLTSFIETALLRAIWYPTTVASFSFNLKRVIWRGLEMTSDDPAAGLPFKLHDFGARGASSAESAGLGGMAHLVNFAGTDTLEGIRMINQVYTDMLDDELVMPGFSIPASEHSTMTAWTQAGEVDAYRNMIEQFKSGMFSIVSDSYDLTKAVVEMFCGSLRADIEAIEGTLVVRPDSGDPVANPVAIIETLWNHFGGTINSKGYRVLDKRVRVIQGDGLDEETIELLINRMINRGLSVDNIAFGMGGALLQKHSRDDLRFAMKANAIDTGDGWVDLQKKPATDPSKTSRAGRQAVYRDENGEIRVMREDAFLVAEGRPENLLKRVFFNGEITSWSFASVRQRAEEEFKRLERLVELETTLA